MCLVRLEHQRDPDEREYSFVDATSFALMRRLAIHEALSFDGGFAAAGFVALQTRRRAEYADLCADARAQIVTAVIERAPAAVAAEGVTSRPLMSDNAWRTSWGGPEQRAICRPSRENAPRATNATVRAAAASEYDPDA